MKGESVYEISSWLQVAIQRRVLIYKQKEGNYAEEDSEYL